MLGLCMLLESYLTQIVWHTGFTFQTAHVFHVFNPPPLTKTIVMKYSLVKDQSVDLVKLLSVIKLYKDQNAIDVMVSYVAG